MSTYVYNPGLANIGYPQATKAMASRYPDVVSGSIDNVSPDRVARVLQLADAAGIPFEPYSVDGAAYRAYFDNAGYASRYADYYRGNQPENSLEHWIALQLLDVRLGDVFIDVASEHSPVPEIYWRLAGACSFGQDISYPPGIVGNRIGGDACAMPLPDAFAHKVSLTCSLEHFEADADVRLFAELARVLKPGGRACIVPFYVFEKDATQTDPQVSIAADVPFDQDTTIYCAEGWGNRHGRFYSPGTFRHKIVDRFADQLAFKFYHLANAGEVHGSVYARFAFVATRR